MGILISQLAVVAPLTAARVLEERATEPVAKQPSVEADELLRASKLVPAEAARVQRIITNMGASTRSALQGSGGKAAAVAAAAASLHAAATPPIAPVVIAEPPQLPAPPPPPSLMGVRRTAAEVGGEHRLVAANGMLFTITGEHWKTTSITALTPSLARAWSHSFEGLQLKAFDVRPDGGVVVAYRKDVAPGEFETGVISIRADGMIGAQTPTKTMQLHSVVCAPQGGFYLVGDLGIEAHGPNGERLWGFETRHAPALALDAHGHLHVQVRHGAERSLLVLDQQGKIVDEQSLTPCQRTASLLLGSNGTTYVCTNETTIDIVDKHGGTSSVTLDTPMLYPPVLLRDGRLAVASWRALTVLNTDGSEAWSMPIITMPSPPVEGPDGTIHLHVTHTEGQYASQHIESFSPSGESVHRSPATATKGEPYSNALMTAEGKLVVHRQHSTEVYE